MPTRPAATADDVAETIRSLIDRITDAKVTQEMAKRGQDVVGTLAERGADAGDRATEVWRETRPLRRDAAKRLSRASGEAARWSNRTWRSSLRPLLDDLWKRRTLAIGAAGAAVPAGKELVDSAAHRLGIRERQEQRHWGAFFLGLLIGVAAGAIAALLTAPKRGAEIRHDLSAKADEVRGELTARARDTEWVPIFQREGPTNGSAGETYADPTGTVREAAASSGSAAEGDAGDRAIAETGEAVGEPYDTVEREPQS
jgi:gas vesicle protein